MMANSRFDSLDMETRIALYTSYKETVSRDIIVQNFQGGRMMYFSVEFSKKNITLIFEDKQQTKNTTWNNKFKFIQFHT